MCLPHVPALPQHLGDSSPLAWSWDTKAAWILHPRSQGSLDPPSLLPRQPGSSTPTPDRAMGWDRMGRDGME